MSKSKKIEKLTPSQIAMFPEYFREWTNIGLSTDPADRPRAEAAIAKMYEIAKFRAPKVVWCGSPLSSAIARRVIKSLCKVSVRDSVRASVWDSVRDSVYGQHEAGWLSFYDFFLRECGLVSQIEPLSGLFELCRSCGWIIPCQEICFASERHNVLHRDDRGRLHCEDGPALAYPDGWELWYVHGVSVNEKIVMRPASQTVSEINAEGNAERRRIRIEKFGWTRYLAESGATCVDRRRNDRDAQEEKLFVIADGTKRFACVDPSTGRTYAIGVPREVETCEQAQLFMSHGLDARAIHRS